MGIASLAGLLSGAGDVDAPNTGSVRNDYRGLLRGYLNSQGKILETEQKYRPGYDALTASSIGSLTPALAGVLDQNAGGIANLVRGISPSQTALLEKLTNQADQGLDAGASLDPSLKHVTQQSIRGGQAARGLGYSPADVLQESTALTSLGNSLRQERQGFASNVAGMNNAYETQPTLSLLSNLLAGTAGLSTKSSSPTLTPTSLSGQLLTMPYQGRLSAATSSAANNTGLYQSMDSNQSSFISGL